jgi:O-antigen biosynthesis protein
LRVSEVLESSEIGHVPRVLYHWRMISGSTAMGPSEKSYAHYAALRAIQDHLNRKGAHARVHEISGASGYFRVAYEVPHPEPLVSILIPTRDRVDLLRQCVDSILKKTTYSNYEIIIIDNDSREAETLQYFATLDQHESVRIVSYPKPFNYSAVNNFGAEAARGALLVLLNNDVEVISPGWLTEMTSHALREEVGVVGAMLYYPNDTIQHAGVVVGIGGVAGHAYVGRPRGFPGDKHRAALTQSVSVVTAACALVRTSVFHEVGGLDEQLVVAFNDVDFCLRVRAKGYRNVWTPHAELYHHESASRGYEDSPEKIARFKREEQFMKDRWGKALECDPMYNLNLSLTSEPYSLAFPPRHTNYFNPFGGVA